MPTYEKTQPDWGFRIELWMIHELGLHGLKRDVYAVVYAFTHKKGNWKQMDMDFLAEFVGSSKRRVQQMIRELVAEGLVEYEFVGKGRGGHVQLRAINPERVKEFHPLDTKKGEEISPLRVKRFHPSHEGKGEEISPLYKLDINKKKKHTQGGSAAAPEPQTTKPAAAASDRVREVVEDDGFAAFAARYHTDTGKLPGRNTKEAARKEWRRLLTAGFTSESIEVQYQAYKTSQEAKKNPPRYWLSLYDFLAEAVEIEHGQEEADKPKTEYPETSPCPACGTAAKHEGHGSYWCPTCQAGFLPAF